MKKVLVMMMIGLCFSACSTTLQVPVVQVNPAIQQYKYVYIIPTNTIIGGYVSGGESSTSGYTKSTNPANVIAGALMERGYIILPQIQDEFKDKTMVVSFGELPSEYSGLTMAKTNVLIQFRDANTSNLIASAKAEGVSKNDWSFFHPTEADGIKQAIIRAINAIFPSYQNTTL
jgi:hypothetical protein